MSTVRPATFTCAYDGEVFGAAPAAHVIPQALGGIAQSRRTVCARCNHATNSEVENPALPFFAFCRSVWGIAEKGRVPPVPGQVQFADGRVESVAIGEDGELRSAIIKTDVGADGKRVYRVMGPDAAVTRAQNRIGKGQQIRWEERSPDPVAGPFVVLDDELDKLVLRRLAAKIAFERAAMLRSGEAMRGAQFESVRRFILGGSESVPVCGVIASPGAHEEQGLFRFGPGPHAVITTTQQDLFGAVVVLFGLFYYWVVLARPQRVADPRANLLLEHPQSGASSSRAGPVGHVFPWDGWLTASVETPRETRDLAFRFAFDRLKRAVDDSYG